MTHHTLLKTLVIEFRCDTIACRETFSCDSLGVRATWAEAAKIGWTSFLDMSESISGQRQACPACSKRRTA